MKFLAVVFFFSSHLLSLSFEQNLPQNDNTPDVLDSPLNRQFIFVGRVGTKSYMAEPTNMNWRAAQETCQNSGLLMASIETAAEYTFLGNAHQTDYFNGFYWVAARDAHTLQQFQWDKGNGTQTDITVGMETFVSSLVQPSLTCGGVYSRFNESLRFDFYPCSLRTLFVLCETP